MTSEDNQTFSPLLLEGRVVHGRQLGRQLGFPTANLDPAELRGEVPATGVYAAFCQLEDGRIYQSMVNVGYCPTVGCSEHRLSIEANLYGFEGDLYGQLLKLRIVARIRDERKMPTLEQLKAQLSHDLDEARSLTSNGYLHVPDC